MTLNKLPGIRGDLVRTDPQWKEWNFGKLVEALKDGWSEIQLTAQNRHRLTTDTGNARNQVKFSKRNKREANKNHAYVFIVTRRITSRRTVQL